MEKTNEELAEENLKELTEKYSVVYNINGNLNFIQYLKYIIILTVSMFTFVLVMSSRNFQVETEVVFHGSDCVPPEPHPMISDCPKYDCILNYGMDLTLTLHLSNPQYSKDRPLLRKTITLNTQSLEIPLSIDIDELSEYDLLTAEIYSHNYEIKYVLRDTKDKSNQLLEQFTSGWASRTC